MRAGCGRTSYLKCAQIEPNVRSSFECFLTLGDNPAYAHGLIYRGTARSGSPASWATRRLPSESGNLSRRSLASRLAGNRFDGRVLWQRVIKRLVDGLFTLSRPSWPTGKRLTSIDSKICLNLR